MDYQREHPSEEDIPSDFFDDFNKDEFIQGLSVVDSWDDDEPSAKKQESAAPRARINAEAVHNVKDLRELIDGKEAPSESRNEDKCQDSRVENSHNRKRSTSSSRLDAYIQPGSRRDPSKTTAAIRRDKEIKLKEYLAKHLESNDDIRPPGTELDDFYENRKSTEKKKNAEKCEEKARAKGSREQRYSPRRYQQYERRSPRRSPQRSPYRRSPHRRSPHRRSPQRPFYRRSPQRHISPLRPRRYSPRGKQKKFGAIRLRDRSPTQHYGLQRSRSGSIGFRDDFLYPKQMSQLNYDAKMLNDQYRESQGRQYQGPARVEYPVNPTEYSYPQGQVYPGYNMRSYEYRNQHPGPSSMAPVPQPVPAPNLAPSLILKTAPAMVPPPHQIIMPAVQAPNQLLQMPNPVQTANDPLAKLVVEGVLSHEDYLKLAPNKGSTNTTDTQAKITVLKRCNQAISELDKLALPTRLLINHSVIGVEQKSLPPKFCSPLKRQVTVEFHFTKASMSATAHQNKQIVDNIIAAVGLEKIVAKKKVQKNVKDAAVQTSKPFCDVCEIRNSTNCNEVDTFTEPKYFCSSVHTQVVEQDLISSKFVFNPTGSASNNPPMSIAHLTPAQLVSQLAARAKTLKQSPDPGQQYGHHTPPNYDGRGPPGRHYHDSYSNYRY